MKRYFAYTFLLLTIAIGCSEDENTFNLTPTIGFTITEANVLESNATGYTVNIVSNTNLTDPVTLTIQVSQNLQYGVDYTTDPEVVNNEIQLTLDPDATVPGSITIYPQFRAVGDRQVTFTITDIDNPTFTLPTFAARTFSFNMRGVSCPLTVVPVTITHNFETCTTNFATPTGFIEAFEPGSKTDRGWGCREFGRNGGRAVRASAFGGSAGDDKAWLIMNPVSVGVGANVNLSFWMFSNFTGPGNVRIKWSSDYAGSGNPLVATWNDLTTLDAQVPAPASQVWTQVQGTFDNICGDNVYFAFQFTGANDDASTSYDLDDLVLTIN